MLEELRRRLLTLPRGAKQVAMLLTDAVSYVVSAIVSFWIVYGTLKLSPPVMAIATMSVLIALPVHWLFGLYASIVRYMGFALLAVGVQSTLVVTTLLMGLSALSGFLSAPIRMGVIFWSFSLICIVGGRLAARMFLSRSNTKREPVIIYGAGDAGAQLTAALLSADDYLPVAIVDDKRSLQGKRVQGLKVYAPKKLETLLSRFGAKGVLLAIPSASRRRRRQVLERVSEFPVHVQTMPEIRDIVSGKARVDDITDVNVEDLLGRDPVPPIKQLLRKPVAGKSVMVTGAGGSIGGELCRQIIRLAPTRLVCLETSEPALYKIDHELRAMLQERDLDTEIVPLLGSVSDGRRVGEALKIFQVQTVYHAAAYKHVPIVEQNLLAGVQNNVFGTLCTTKAALEHSVETFVLISTDKAVNPTSVMGATKRLAELILQAYDHHGSTTRFCMVRFGNVLESSGSVVPLFREQIRNGGPVTVTHRDIIRYFMTIPEAAQLVIQASAMADGGDVFVLDMGSPVRIEDLARRMINLMGMSVQDDANPDGDIEIQYIGLRPAEKLFEELLIGSNVSGTEHARIMRANEDHVTMDVLTGLLAELGEALDKADLYKVRELLTEAVREYSPENGIDDLLWRQSTAASRRTADPSIIRFPKRES